MKKLVEFEFFGVAVVPWSVPDIGVSRRGGKAHRFTKRTKKSALHLGKATLEQWQGFVKDAARQAMATIPTTTQSVRVHIEFYAATPPGKRHGQLWEVPLHFRSEEGDYTKSQPRGKPEADLINMFKGTEDAIEGAVVENDVQTRMVSSVALYGPMDGVRVRVYLIEPGDFPGTGDPVE